MAFAQQDTEHVLGVGGSTVHINLSITSRYLCYTERDDMESRLELAVSWNKTASKIYLTLQLINKMTACMRLNSVYVSDNEEFYCAFCWIVSGDLQLTRRRME